MVIGNFLGEPGAKKGHPGMSFKGEEVPIKSVLYPKSYNGESSISDFAIMFPDWENSPFQVLKVQENGSFSVPEYQFPTENEISNVLTAGYPAVTSYGTQYNNYY